MGKFSRFMRRNYMIDTFLKLKGNTRACVWTEPLWGVPYNLYMPYVTRFMIALGLSMTQIGIISTITMLSEIVSSILSGVLTDKLGRRWCTVIFDTLSWSIPEILWACSQNFTWFIVAALFNGMWRITENSWGLLLVEDTPRDQIVPVFSMSSFMGVVAAIIAPISKFAIDSFGLVSTMRVLYAVTFVSMTAKFLILFFCSKETGPGVERMKLTKNVPMWKLLWECKDVYIRIIKEKRMLLTLGLLGVNTLINTVNTNCWATYIVDNLHIRESDLSWFSMTKGFITLIAILVLVPRLKKVKFRKPMLSSIALYASSQIAILILGFTSAPSYVAWPALIACVGCEAIAVSMLSPLTSSLLFINADPDERARVCGMVYATIALTVCVFPTIIGWLADISMYLPFFVNLMLFAAFAILTILISKLPTVGDYDTAG